MGLQYFGLFNVAAGVQEIVSGHLLLVNCTEVLFANGGIVVFVITVFGKTVMVAVALCRTAMYS